MYAVLLHFDCSQQLTHLNDTQVVLLARLSEFLPLLISHVEEELIRGLLAQVARKTAAATPPRPNTLTCSASASPLTKRLRRPVPVSPDFNRLRWTS